MVPIGPVKSDKIFQGRGVFHQTHPFFWGGGVPTVLIFKNDFSQISMTSGVWRRGRREKRRPDSGCNSVIHGRISSPIRSSVIIKKNSVFEHTPPPKEIYIFDRTYWNHILGFNIWASLSFDGLTTKKSDGPFLRKSSEDYSKIISTISKKGLIKFFLF